MSAFETLSCSSVLDSAMVIPTGHYSLPASTSNSISSQMNADQREIPVAEVLMSQIEVQKRLQEQLEVQKKLQMRIEAQGKYLQSILEKAQKSLTLDVNNPINLEKHNLIPRWRPESPL